MIQTDLVAVGPGGALRTVGEQVAVMPRYVWFGYVAWAGLLSVTYFFLPAVGVLPFAGVVLAATAAIFGGIRRHRPRRRLPWVLLAVSYLAFAAGTAIAVLLSDVLHERAFPSLADVAFLGVSTPALIASLLILTRSGARIRDTASRIDALIVTAAAAILSWTFLITPRLHDPNLSWPEWAISIAYPLSDVLILAIIARLAIGTRRSPSAVLLLVSVGALLVADVLYGLSQLNGAWQLGGPIDLGWAVFLLAGGAAALHPSMVELTEPQVVLQPTDVKLRRLVLGAAALVAPTVLLVESLSGSVGDGVIIAIGSAILVLLAIARMSVVAKGLRQTLTRERELRLAGQQLASATDDAHIQRAVLAAVAGLVPPDTPHRTVLMIHDAEPLEADDRTVGMRYTRKLPVEIARQLPGFELTLHCPLVLATDTVGDLFVAGPEVALVELQEAAQLLAGQAAAMLGNLALHREVNRRDSDAYFRTLVLNAADVIVIVDAQDCITYASPSAQPTFEVETLVGRSLVDLVVPPLRHQVIETLRQIRAGHLHNEAADWRMLRATGDEAEVEVAIRDLRQESTVAGLVLTIRDITEARRLERELLRRAYVDQLTGLGNRLQFQDAARRVFGSATSTMAGVLLLDINDFRSVNDTMGHAVGDELLIAVSQRLAVAVPGTATVARLGADEFGVVIDRINEPAEMAMIAERILAQVSTPFLIAGSILTAQSSIGVATSDQAADHEQLLRQADVALATAKAEATTHWRQYESSLHVQVLHQMKLRTELDQAIANQAFTMHYQPIVDLFTARPRGVEALVRWEHPTLGMIPPTEFIQLAEESGLIIPLGDWILHTAVAAAAAWRGAFPLNPPSISVNVSVRQFRGPGFVDRVFAELSTAHLPPALLTIEITESLFFGQHERIHADIGRLRQAGVKVSIDDFGTGYSSLSYLDRVLADAIKLDKTFVDTIATSPQQFNLVRGIVQLAKTLQLDVVAEGIETDEDWSLLVDAGCEYGQGYLFARPMSESEVTRWLQAYSSMASIPGPNTND